MKIFAASLAILATTFAASISRADVLTAIPGPDDQGGMIMPMVILDGNTLSLMFMPTSTPELASLEKWSPGNTFQPTAAWYAQLDPTQGNSLFNNQYGFTFMVDGGTTFPLDKGIGIRLTAVSSNLLQSWNYVNSQNRFDEIFQDVGDQVLWNGSMWHNYFTLPEDAAPGTYTASFEVFIANTTFTPGTGFADYTSGAQSATQDNSYNTVTINYTWEVVPEPSTYLLLGGAALFFLVARLRHRNSARA